MYTKQIPHKNFLGKVRNQTVHFNLTTHEFFKLLVEFKAIFDWQDRLEKENDPDAVTDTREIVAYYNNFEEILLSAYGEPDESGDHFRKAGRYDFAESSLFHACMEMFVQDPEETSKLVEAMVPEGLAELIKKLDANAVAMIANEETPEAMKRELERLRAQEAAREAQALAQKSSSDS
jgi:hypothetical protein